MKKSMLIVSASAALLLAVGCKTSYVWTSSVPQEMRTISVPTFSNGSEVSEIGSVTTRQLLREIQREGTFKIASRDDAAVEIQGKIVSARTAGGYGDRRSGMRLSEHIFTVVAQVSVIDRRRGKVLINNREYMGETTYVMSQDLLTGERNASGRAADDLAQKVVDDLTSMQW